MDLPGDFLNEKSIATFGGATLVVFLVVVTSRRLLGVVSLFVPFVTSLVISFALAQHDGKLGSLLGWIITIANALLLFCSVTGMNETVADAAHPKPAGQLETQARRPRRWFQSMFERDG
jgi:hypothetical protein